VEGKVDRTNLLRGAGCLDRFGLVIAESPTVLHLDLEVTRLRLACRCIEFTQLATLAYFPLVNNVLTLVCI
jgi:hypothetical protein